MFRTCRRVIATVPSLVYDTHRVEDVAHDDVYDALRYGVMSRPHPAPPVVEKPKPDSLAHVMRLAREARAREEALGWKGF